MSPEDRFVHVPVMVGEVVDALAPAEGRVSVDATVGGGGHAEALLDGPHPPRRLVGLDRDPAAVEAARARLGRFGARARVVHSGYARLVDQLDEDERGDVGGVLFDLGVSSHQLDSPARGFSFRHDGPLDMRMDPAQDLTADHVVNTWSASDLAGAIGRYGEERFAIRIARAIVAARPLRSTVDLAEIVRAAVPAATRRRGGHPARRTFQALRIVVNAELDHLERALRQAAALLCPGGALAVLSYHSLEDRIAKTVIRELSSPRPLPPGLPVEPQPAPFRAVGRARRPAADEVAANPRAEAAKLRVLERVA